MRSRAGAAALVDRVPAGLPEQASLVVVDDTMAALDRARAGGAARAAGHGIAALTGSVGKTGTKEALRLALAAQAPTHASAASHNNHWGVPLSLARAPRDAVYGIYELGMNAPGEIATLARLVRPHVAMITTVEAAHLGFFPLGRSDRGGQGRDLPGHRAGRRRGPEPATMRTSRVSDARRGGRLRARDRLRRDARAPRRV